MIFINSIDRLLTAIMILSRRPKKNKVNEKVINRPSCIKKENAFFQVEFLKSPLTKKAKYI